MQDPATPADPIGQIEALRVEAESALAAATGVDALEQFRIKYLGTKGRLKDLMKLVGVASPADKPRVGQQANATKLALTAAFEARLAAATAGASTGRDAIDVTEPGRVPLIGRPHVITKVTEELLELFGRLGFTTAQGPELEDDWHNFVALNIPASHPARDPNDNFYLDSEGEPGTSGTLLRTQTSTVQVRIMETQKPPLRVVIPGRVYRPDTIDSTHLPMFHQLEALVVDEGVTMVDLKSTVLQFVKGYFGLEAKIRFRPSFFPFTEPSAEVDVWFEDKGRWIELGGCGMVHPTVLGNCGIDPEQYSGWAFGFGVERIAMRKYAIGDIRMLVENDLRFLAQL